jgi:hypothetical protein
MRLERRQLRTVARPDLEDTETLSMRAIVALDLEFFLANARRFEKFLIGVQRPLKLCRFALSPGLFRGRHWRHAADRFLVRVKPPPIARCIRSRRFALRRIARCAAGEAADVFFTA